MAKQRTAKQRRAQRDDRGREASIAVLTDEKTPQRLFWHLTHGTDRELESPWFNPWIHLSAAGVVTEAEVRALHLNLISDLERNGMASNAVSLMAVSVPLPSVGMRPGYLAVRVIAGTDRVRFVSFLPKSYLMTVANVTSEVWFTSALVGEARIGGEGPCTIQDLKWGECLNHLNDLLLAYKAVRHDHSVSRLTQKTVPSVLETFTSTIGSFGSPAITSESISFSDNDLHQVISKSVIRPGEMQAIKLLAEQSTSPPMKYLIQLALGSIEAFCNGFFESAVLDSDRFVELSLKVLLTAEPGFENVSLQSWSFHESRTDGKVIVETLANCFDLAPTTLFASWRGNARKARNRIVHGLDFEPPTADVARLALRLNLQLVSTFVEARPHRLDDFSKLAGPYKEYCNLYELGL